MILSPQEMILTDLIRSSNRIVVVTGAGISVAAGIPDYRSLQGIYKTQQQGRLSKTGFFDYLSLSTDAVDFLKFHGEFIIKCRAAAKNIPLTHRWLYDLGHAGKLLAHLDQNIDCISAAAGLEMPILHCVHGSYAFARCVCCGNRTSMTDELVQHMIHGNLDDLACPNCLQPQKRVAGKMILRGEKASVGILIPDLVYYNDPRQSQLPDLLKSLLAHKPDLLLIIGTSLSTPDMQNFVADFLQKSKAKAAVLNIGKVNVNLKTHLAVSISDRAEDILRNIVIQ